MNKYKLNVKTLVPKKYKSHDDMLRKMLQQIRAILYFLETERLFLNEKEYQHINDDGKKFFKSVKK